MILSNRSSFNSQQWNGLPQGRLELHVGNRVVISNDFLRTAPLQRRGVIALIRDCMIEEKGRLNHKKKNAQEMAVASYVRFIVVALDNLLVTRPSPIDAEFAQELMMDPKRIYSFKAMAARTAVEKIEMDYGTATQSTLYCCESCLRVVQYCDLIPFQSFMVCKSHICPWNEVSHEPNLTEVGPLYCRIHDIATRSRLAMPPFTEAKAMVLKSKYDKLLQTMQRNPMKVKSQDLVTILFFDIFGCRSKNNKHTMSNINTELNVSANGEEVEIVMTIKENTIIQYIPFSLLQYFLVNGFESKFEAFRQRYQFPIYESRKLLLPPSGRETTTTRPRDSAESIGECILHIKTPYFKLMPKASTIILRPGATFYDLWNEIESLPYSFFRQKFHLFIQRLEPPLLYGQMPFCFPLEEVKKVNQDHIQHAMGMNQLESVETLEIYREHPVISPPLQLHALIGDFPHNMELIAKAVDLSEVYSGFRRIKGDGNCYYRAVMFSYMEQLIALTNRDLQRQLIDQFSNKLWETKGDHTHLIQYLSKMHDQSILLSDFIDDLVQRDDCLDIALVVAAKAILTHYILNHRGEDISGTTLEDLWLAYYGGDDVRTLEDCCAVFIERLDLSAEGPFVNMGLIFKALGCGGMLVMLDRRQEVPLSLVHCPPPLDNTDRKGDIMIHLLLRPGHFDLLYPDAVTTIEKLLERYNFEAKKALSPASNLPMEAEIVRLPSRVNGPYYEIVPQRFKISALWNERLEQSGVCFAQDSLEQFEVTKRLILSEEMYGAYKQCDPHTSFSFPPNRSMRIIKCYEQSVDDISHRIILPSNCVIVRFEAFMASTDSTGSSCIKKLCCIDLTRFSTIAELETVMSEHLGREYEVARPDRNSFLEFLRSILILEDDLMVSGSNLPLSIQDIILQPAEKMIKLPIQCMDLQRTIGISSKIAFDRFLKQVKLNFGLRSSFKLCSSQSVDVTRDNFNGLLFTKENNENNELYPWHLQYCFACESQHREEDASRSGKGTLDPSLKFDELPCCRRYLCRSCLNNLADSFPSENLFICDEDAAEPTPQLNAQIVCPSCNRNIPEELLQFCSRYNNDFSILLTTPKKPPQVRCALGYYDCADMPLTLDQVVQLGCDHFICHECLTGSIQNEIQKAKMIRRKICCPACTSNGSQSSASASGDEGSTRCFCIQCLNFNNDGPHIITPEEMEYWVDLNILERKDLNDWEDINMKIASQDDPESKQIECRCSRLYFVSIHRTEKEVLCPYGCNYTICTECGSEAHPGVSCNNNVGGLDLSSLYPRTCEKCGFIGTLPEDCNHITCQCNYQYCFICEAPHLQYVNHDVSYHRPACGLYRPCCEKNCRLNGKTHCDEVKYNPGPCDICVASNQANNCKHSDWRACSQCMKANQECSHFCPECKAFGRTCIPPTNKKADGTLYQIYSLEDVEKAKNSEKKNGEKK